MIGEVIDHYRVLELVGRGAMGVVYKALDVNLDRLVAIKVMSAEARNAPDFVERFRQEARVQGALNHPNVAQLFDYFVHEGAPVAVMEFIDGESLEQMIRRRGRIPAHEGVPIFRQALLGVAAAHRAGIIHRDLKPGNLMVTRDNIVKVMDFGIAKRRGVTGLTKVSTSIGTSLYVAPEQILGRAVDCRTDVYSLGITLYELLSGQPPFNPRGKVEYMVLNAHVNDLPEPPTVHCSDIPQPIVAAVMRALAKSPEARFQSVDEFMRALPDVPAAHESPSPVDPGDTVAFEFQYPPTTSGAAFATTRLEPRAPASTALATSTVLATSTALATPAASAAPPASPASRKLRGTRPSLLQILRSDSRTIVVVLGAMLVMGALMRHAQRLHAARGNASVAGSAHLTGTQTPTAMPAPADPAAPPPADVPGTEAMPTTATPLASNPAPSRPDLSGTWSGAYVDASGRQLLRVVTLSISRVDADGGIEGSLQYAAASGDGECALHPRGSAYSALEQRLQLSPESCSPHYPKELGVPLDFDGVNPRANTLKDGRIEAPTGEVIRVRLRRVRSMT